MANTNILDATGASKYIKATGAGTNGDPFVPEHLETNSAAILSALQVIDNMIVGSEAQVDVVTLPSLPAGANTIGNVTVSSLPSLPTGANVIGSVAITSGTVTVNALPAGTNNIGDVDVLTLPALPAGTNNIGDVDVLSLPALPAGSNTIGNVGLTKTISVPYVGTVTASGDTTIITPTSGTRLRVVAWSFWNETATATKATIKTSAVNIDAYYLFAQGYGKNGELNPNEDLILATNAALVINLSVATTVGYSIRVQEV